MSTETLIDQGGTGTGGSPAAKKGAEAIVTSSTEKRIHGAGTRITTDKGTDTL